MNEAKIRFFDRDTGEPVDVSHVFDEIIQGDRLQITTRAGKKLYLTCVSEPYFIIGDSGWGGKFEAGETIPRSINEQTLMEQLDSVGDTVCTMSDEELRVLQQEQAAINRKNRKWDDGKLKYSLILPEFLELMAEILTRGEINHPCEPDGTPSWQLVEPKAYEDALFRHFQKYRKGEIIDTDPNMPTDHMGNIAVNAMFLWWFNRQKEKANDEWA